MSLLKELQEFDEPAVLGWGAVAGAGDAAGAEGLAIVGHLAGAAFAAEFGAGFERGGAQRAGGDADAQVIAAVAAEAGTGFQGGVAVGADGMVFGGGVLRLGRGRLGRRCSPVGWSWWD